MMTTPNNNSSVVTNNALKDFAKLEQQISQKNQEAENARKQANAVIEKNQKIAAYGKKMQEYKAKVEAENKKIQNGIKLYTEESKQPTPNQALLDGYSAAIKDATARRDAYQKEYDAAKKEQEKVANTYPGSTPYKPPASSSGDGQAPKPKFEFSQMYYYNAPMVKENYFSNGGSIVNTMLDGKFVDQGKFDDARQAWQGTTGGRGVLQMDQRFLSTFTGEYLQSPNFDLKKYGFKFLYNPQTVSMSWGLLQNMDPYFEATGQDKFQVVATALLASTVSFDLLLNRVKDFDYINENGLLAGLKNPYPEIVNDDEAKIIYKKGTMYDLEYLFRVINGPNADFKSDISGMMTADRAWLKPAIMELHLGDSMRYRVRISEFSVNHVIFNSKMVPILSTVKLSFNRFADGDVVGKGAGSARDESGGALTSTTPSTTSVVSGTNALRNSYPGYGR